MLLDRVLWRPEVGCRNREGKVGVGFSKYLLQHTPTSAPSTLTSHLHMTPSSSRKLSFILSFLCLLMLCVNF